MLVGSLRTSGITTYMKQGKLITRSSNSYQKRSNTMSQFADEMKGWALVRVTDDRCSTQSIVTRCPPYQQYTT